MIRRAMRLIKRYPNRKLYDTAQKQYVTLLDIARLIREGREVQVTDYASGEDLTAITLTQIILEQEKKQAGFLPRAVLRGLVQTGGERMSTLRRALVLTETFEEELERVLARLNVPSRADVQKLEEQLDHLLIDIDLLLKQRVVD